MTDENHTALSRDERVRGQGKRERLPTGRAARFRSMRPANVAAGVFLHALSLEEKGGK